MEIWVWYVIGVVAAGILRSMFGVGAGILLVKSFSKPSGSASLQNPENSTAENLMIPSE